MYVYILIDTCIYILLIDTCILIDMNTIICVQGHICMLIYMFYICVCFFVCPKVTTYFSSWILITDM